MKATWWALLAAAALLVLVASGLLLVAGGPLNPPNQPGGAAGFKCLQAQIALPSLAKDADATGVVVWASGSLRVLIDGDAVYSPIEAPRRFNPGSHRLRVESSGDGWETSFDVEPFRPVLVFVESTAAGIAVSVKKAQWLLTGKPLKARELPKRPENAEFKALETQLAALERSEAGREKSVSVERWNQLSARSSRLLNEFAREAPGPSARAATRLAELSAQFARVVAGAPHERQLVVNAGDETLRQLVAALRAASADCEFQRRVSDAF